MTTLSSGAAWTGQLVVAGPNLTIDRTMRLPELTPGRVLRATEVEATPGGKGVNVARAALAIGIPATLVAFLPGHTGQAVAALLAEAGVRLRAVTCPGELRSTGILMEEGGRVTVLNEPGPPVTAELWGAYEAEIADALDGAAVLVCSGSLPPSAPPDGYARLVTLARSRDVLTVVDVGGTTLKAALQARPDIVVPNLGEAEALLAGAVREDVDAPADARPRATAAARALVGLGAHAAAVTAAAAGAALAIAPEAVGRAAIAPENDPARSDGANDEDGPWWLAAPPGTVRNPIGAGDCFAAGLAAALARGAPVPVAAREAVATGTAGVESPLGGDFDRARMRELLAHVTLVSA
jgi:1-phosphofructokinase